MVLVRHGWGIGLIWQGIPTLFACLTSFVHDGDDQRDQEKNRHEGLVGWRQQDAEQ